MNSRKQRNCAPLEEFLANARPRRGLELHCRDTLALQSEPGVVEDRDAKAAGLARGIVTAGQDGAAGLGSGVRPRVEPDRPQGRARLSTCLLKKRRLTIRELRFLPADSPFDADGELTSAAARGKFKRCSTRNSTRLDSASR